MLLLTVWRSMEAVARWGYSSTYVRTYAPAAGQLISHRNSKRFELRAAGPVTRIVELSGQIVNGRLE